MCRILVLLALGLPALAAGDDAHCDAQLDAPDEVDLLQVQREERSLRAGQGRGDCPPVPTQCEGINPEMCVYLDPQCLGPTSLEGCYAGGTDPECRYCNTPSTPKCSDVVTTTTKKTTPTTTPATTTTKPLKFAQMVEQQNSLCLDEGSKTGEEPVHWTNADAAACTKEDSQLWALSDDQELIVKAGSLCLTGGMTTAAYFNTVLMPCDGSDAQKFTIEPPNCDPTHNNGCLFKSVGYPSYCLDYTAVAGDDNNVYLHSCHGNKNQKWQFVPPR